MQNKTSYDCRICACDRYWCQNEDKNLSPAKRLKLFLQPITHDTLHSALRKKDCALVSHLTFSGVRPCSTDGIENCFILITKYWNAWLLQRMLLIEPSAIHCRGPRGHTLLMYAKDPNTIDVLVSYKPDINAVNENGDNLLLHAVKEYQREASASQTVLLQSILETGVEINRRDASGKTALDYVWKGKSNNWLLVRLLEAGAAVPPPDAKGQTVLMQVVREMNHEDVDIAVALLCQGADASARDSEGHNAMFHAILALRQSRDMYYVVTRVARVCFELHRCGCELEGLDIPFEAISNIDFHEFAFITHVSFNILSLILRFSMYSKFIMELNGPNLRMMNPNSVSLLTCYFLGYHRWQYHHGELSVIEKTVTHLLDNEVEVTQRVLCFDMEETDAIAWSEKLRLPDVLWLATQVMLRIPVGTSFNAFKRGHSVIGKILVSLLRFWPHPPLALMLFPFEFCHSKTMEAPLGMLMLNFLTRIGGPLPSGSPIMQALKNKFTDEEPNSGNKPAGKFLDHFLRLHAHVPTLRELCRPAVRATLSRTNKTGLDLSSLQTLVNGCMREIPKSIQEFLSFSDQPVFEINDVPPVIRVRFDHEHGDSETDFATSSHSASVSEHLSAFRAELLAYLEYN